MNKLYSLLLVALLGALSTTLTAQVVLEDFEGGMSDLTWNALDGTFEGPVANPVTDSRVNSSAFVGKYTKDSTKAFSLLLAEFATPIQLTPSTNQAFIDVYASEDTRLILKLEGTGPAIEKTMNIPATNRWVRLRFDFSAAAATTTFTKVILFFDAGNEMGKGMYHFDNLLLGTDPCAGIERDPAIIDDFACQRASIRAGQDSLTIVDNPFPDAVNGPGKVGRYSDPTGGFSALVYDADGSIITPDKPVLKLKYYSPIPNRLLLKLERGNRPAREIGIDVTVTNQWQEYTFDFSEVADGNYRTLVIFTNAGVDDPGVVYYFDDIRFEPVVINYLEDFEGDNTNLFWQPRNSNTAVNGTFSVVGNPDKSGLNLSDSTGAHTKGSSMLSTLVALAPNVLDLTVNSQVNMLIYAPAGSQTVRMSAISPSRGRLDVDRDITATGEWVEVSFNFADFADAGDVSSFELVFDPELGGARTYYFDQIYLGPATVNPCEGTEPIANFIDNFECQRNAPVTGGAERLKVVNNPDFTGNPSEKVGEYTHDGNQFSLIVYDFTGKEPDLTVFNNLVFDLWTPREVPMAVKLEGSTNGAPNKEIPFMSRSAMMWETYRISFDEVADGKYQRLVIFFNFNTNPGGAGDKYYIDNLRFARGPVTACATDFETPNTTFAPFNGFAGGSIMGEDAFAVVDNPQRGGINPSAKVGQFTESTDGESFQGIFFNIGAPVLFPDPANKKISAKVLSSDAIDFVFKLEGSATGAPGTGDVFPVTKYSTPGMWQELTWDFTDFDTDAARYQQITLIPGIGEVPMTERITYFDDIVIGNAMCGPVGTRETREAIVGMRAYPNPTAGEVYVEVPARTTQLQVIDALGRLVMRQATSTPVDGGLQSLPMDAQSSGFYTVVALDANGTALARVRVAVAE